jgi:hypothetical protein
METSNPLLECYTLYWSERSHYVLTGAIYVVYLESIPLGSADVSLLARYIQG